MALDKQRILNELGSVMNQLQSADCGCMGKLFNNTNPNANMMGAPLPTCGGCRRGCCHGHGYGAYNQGSSGDAYNAMSTNRNGMPCTPTRCNPAKLYSDTYQYLNENMMQPAVQEVYNDLKSLTPTNTIVNNPMAQQMGLSGQAQNESMTGQMNGMNANSPGMDTKGMTNVPPMATQQQMQGAGMGPNIFNMLQGNANSKPMGGANERNLTEPMVIDAPNSPHGKVGVQRLTTPLTIPGGNNMMGTTNTVQHMSSNLGPNHPPQYSPKNINQQGLSGQQIPNQTHGHHHHHGNPGMKFNDMFPGVMKTFGDDLGFDPMAIAIQMNPENSKRAAMEKMQNMMFNIPEKGKELGTNNKMSNQTASEVPQSTAAPSSVLAEQSNPTSNSKPLEKPSTPETLTPMNQNNPNVFSAITGNTMLKQQPNETGSGVIPENAANSSVPANPSDPSANTTKPEPILPVDTANTRLIQPEKVYYQYNTLGQPVELIPAEYYQIPEDVSPLTLSPKPVPMSQLLSQNKSPYSNVKSTMSKTSIVGQNLNKTASKSQLKHLYNQYHGSQSYTQQNIQAPLQKLSNSEGRINEPQMNAIPNSAPVEKVGGDTLANSRLDNKIGNVIGQIGDVPPIKEETLKPMSPKPATCRNGIQDVVFTSYPTSTAWSFHGRSETVPYSSRYFQRK